MRDLLEYILTNIIDNPDQLSIEEETEDDVLRFNVNLAEEDYPKVIGKRGLTVKGITDILRLFNNKENPDSPQKIYVNIRS